MLVGTEALSFSQLYAYRTDNDFRIVYEIYFSSRNSSIRITEVWPSGRYLLKVQILPGIARVVTRWPDIAASVLERSKCTQIIFVYETLLLELYIKFCRFVISIWAQKVRSKFQAITILMRSSWVVGRNANKNGNVQPLFHKIWTSSYRPKQKNLIPVQFLQRVTLLYLNPRQLPWSPLFRQVTVVVKVGPVQRYPRLLDFWPPESLVQPGAVKMSAVYYWILVLFAWNQHPLKNFANICRPLPLAGKAFPIGGCNRSFSEVWLSHHFWMAYSENVDSVFCVTCCIFSANSSRGRFVSQPFHAWNKKSERVKEHQRCNYHQSAMEMAGHLKHSVEHPNTIITPRIDAHRGANIKRNCEVLKSIARAVLYCHRQCITLRGDAWGIDLPRNPGNFLALPKVMAVKDEVLRNHLEAPARRCATGM